MRGKTYHQMNINEWLLFLVAKTYKSGRLISLTKAFKKRPISNFSHWRKKKSKDKKEENLKKKRENGVPTRKKVNTVAQKTSHS